MKLYSYIVKHDTGFSPNPFWGYCTLADCKPVIRRTANIGDWIVGLSPKSEDNKIIFAMEVQEILTYSQYYHDKRYRKKIPDFTRDKTIYRCGDNIYEPLANGRFRQLQSMHSDEKQENRKTKEQDLRGKNILISKNFYYFGSKSIPLPEKLHEMKVGRAHKSRFSPEIIEQFAKCILECRKGVNAPPTKWPRSDDSWKSELV